MCICRDRSLIKFSVVFVNTTKKTASSAGATITEGHCYICSFHFGTEIPKVFCIEEIVSSSVSMNL